MDDEFEQDIEEDEEGLAELELEDDEDSEEDFEE